MESRGIKGRKEGKVILLNDKQAEKLRERKQAAEGEPKIEAAPASEPQAQVFKPGGLDAARAIYQAVMEERGAPLPPIELEVTGMTKGGVAVRRPLKALPKAQ